MRKTINATWLIGRCSIAVASALLASAASQAASNFFTDLDSNHDGYVSRGELRAATASWLNDGAGDSAGISRQQLSAALDRSFPETLLTSMLASPGPQNQTPKASDVAAMEAALPRTAPTSPKSARRVLVLSKAAGYVHSCIPLAAKTVEELGARTGAWTATITYDSASINADNLKQYDAVFLNNTTGAFLDDPDPSVTAARKKALLDFVRSGKGLAGIHAAGDSYHEARQGAGMGPTLAPGIMTAADTDHNGRLSAAELSAFSDKLYDGMDPQTTGKLSDTAVRSRILFAMFKAGSQTGGAPRMPVSGRTGPDPQFGTWPEFDTMIGGYFKWHWTDPTHIVYHIDDPGSPLTAMFRGGPFSIDDETYTFSVHSWSRHNVHVLTSIDYSAMSDADKAKEDYPRPDHDYGLSWIRREGNGRVFYMAHGHDEKVYANNVMLEHLLAGIQYALGDLKANDSPSQ